jgi:hypothetical protein
MVKFEEVKELLIRKGFYFENPGDVCEHWNIKHPAITDSTVHLGSIFRDSLYLHEKLYNWDSRTFKFEESDLAKIEKSADVTLEKIFERIRKERKARLENVKQYFRTKKRQESMV